MNIPHIGRFAPSPTGPLHFGSLLAALASHLDARACGGAWHVRIDDIDETRCRPEYADDILQTLHAFGFRWDGEVVVQSRQKIQYAAALQQLVDGGHIYACMCSRREIADSAVHGIDGAVYPGTCRHARHALPHNALRVVTDDRAITFVDRLQGTQTQHLATDVGDFVVKRRDGLFAYQLAAVVDDHALGVTDIVRGADLLDSTARQIHLQQLLGYTTPSYLHIPVATNRLGQKLSKQTLAPAITAADAISHLQAALDFLGQARPLDAPATPSLLLKHATRHWQPAAIPQSRDGVAPTSG